MLTVFKTLLISLAVCFLLLLPLSSTVFAQNSLGTLGVARQIVIKDKNIKDGSLVSNTEKEGTVLSTVSYDPQVIGVVSRDAAILIDDQDSNKGVPVIATGTVYVLVSAKEGRIKKGDLLATSTIPGVAVKAVKSGFVVGTALEDAENTDPKRIEKLAVDVDLHYFNSKPIFPGSLSDIFKIAFLPTKDSPNAIFKYIVAAAVVLASIILGFMSFGRTAAKGIEALGRNPAASRIIHLGIIFNITIVIVIVLAGLTIGFLILRL